jgi:hypothetical protein
MNIYILDPAPLAAGTWIFELYPGDLYICQRTNGGYFSHQRRFRRSCLRISDTITP